MWYAAHVIMQLKFQDGLQDIHPVWEEIYIIEAPTSNDAYAEADRIGYFNESADTGPHFYGNRPVRWKYAGVRRLSECIDFDEGVPKSGQEVTYISYFLEDEDALQRILAQKSAKLLIDGEDIT